MVWGIIDLPAVTTCTTANLTRNSKTYGAGFCSSSDEDSSSSSSDSSSEPSLPDPEPEPEPLSLSSTVTTSTGGGRGLRRDWVCPRREVINRRYGGYDTPTAVALNEVWEVYDLRRDGSAAVENKTSFPYPALVHGSASLLCACNTTIWTETEITVPSTGMTVTRDERATHLDGENQR